MPPKTRANAGQGGSSKKDAHNRHHIAKVNESNVSNSNHEDNSNANEDNLGSGLASFFGDFLPYQSDANGEPIGFSTGLSKLPLPDDPIQNADHIENDVIGVRYVEGGLLYSEWRRKEKEYLTEYLMLRLHPHPEEYTSGGDGTLSSSESSIDEDNNGDETAEKTQQESQLGGMETQEPLAAVAAPKPVKIRKQTVPCVEDCLHDLNKLEFLDLYARTLSISLSKINKVWKLRDTKRLPKGSLSIPKPVFFGATHSPLRSRKKNLVFEEQEEDGPVATIYKKVVHLEVEQLHLAQDHLPLPPNHHTKRFPHRVKVFFYDSYAIAVSEWIQEQQQKQRQSGTKRKHSTTDTTSTTTTSDTTDIVMSLSNVPSACIFPYAVDPRNWREKLDLVDYCLCIGDKSVATNRKNQQQQQQPENLYAGSEHQIRFDSNEMEIRLMTVVTKTTTSKTSTAAGSIITNDTVNEVDQLSELVLSKHALAKEFMSSSNEESAPVGDEEREVRNNFDQYTISPLQTSWETYQKNRDPKKSNSSRHSVSASNEGLTICHVNQKGQQQSQDRSPTNDKQSNDARNINNKPVDLEPMIIQGVIQTRSDSRDMNYIQLGVITNMVEQNRNAGKGCNFKVNLYASVVAVTPPRITKRGDWTIAATLIDESCPTPMTINIFCKKQDQLPQLIWMGDVIRIHRAAVEKWCNKIQLQGLKPTQYVVIRRIGGKWQVIPTARSTFNKSDKERSQALWRWANRHFEKSPSMKSEHCFTLEEMQHLKKDDDETTFEHKDITVMVVQKLRYQSSDALPHGLLRVWDGTGNTPSDPLFMPGKLLNPLPEEQRKAAYPRAIEKVISTSQQLQASFGSMEIPISLSGRLSNVVIWEKAHWALIQKQIPVGTFLRLRNVHIPQRWEANNFRSIFMHDKSWMTGLPTNNFEVRSLLFHHNERVRRHGSPCYNREFLISGPTTASSICKFVGNGLHDWANDETKHYTGAVRIRVEEKGESDETITVILLDRSGSLPAVATPKIYLQLRKDNFLDPAAPSNRRFLVTIFKIILDDKEEEVRFVLTNLAPMDG